MVPKRARRKSESIEKPFVFIMTIEIGGVHNSSHERPARRPEQRSVTWSLSRSFWDLFGVPFWDLLGSIFDVGNMFEVTLETCSNL